LFVLLDGRWAPEFVNEFIVNLLCGPDVLRFPLGSVDTLGLRIQPVKTLEAVGQMRIERRAFIGVERLEGINQKVVGMNRQTFARERALEAIEGGLNGGFEPLKGLIGKFVIELPWILMGLLPLRNKRVVLRCAVLRIGYLGCEIGIDWVCHGASNSIMPAL
jgi:hypothetical protein